MTALGPCEFPKCPDPRNERPDSMVHCQHKGENLWDHTVPPNWMHHLLIQSADTSVTAPTKAERLKAALEEQVALYAKYQAEWDAIDAKYQPEWDALRAKFQLEWDALDARIRALEAEP